LHLGDLLFIQVCSDATQVHCSTGQGKIASLLSSAALQNSLTAALCHCNCTYGDLLFIQVCSDATQVHYNTGQGKTASLLFSAALQNRLTAALCHCNPKPVLLCNSRSHLVWVTAVTPMEICCSYRCAVMQHQCTAAIAGVENTFLAIQCCSAN